MVVVVVVGGRCASDGCSPGRGPVILVAEVVLAVACGRCCGDDVGDLCRAATLSLSVAV